MIVENNVDYFIVQARIQNGLSIQDGIVQPFKSILTGSSFKKSNKEQRVFYSTNDPLNNSDFKNNIDIQMFTNHLQDIYKNQCEITLSNTFYNDAKQLISQLGEVLNFVVIVKHDEQFDIYLKDNYNIKSVKRLLSVDITMLVNISNYPVLIKRECELLNQENLENQIQKHIQKIVDEYVPYIHLPYRDVSHEELDLILPAGQGGILIHETVGHALEADYFFNEKSFLYDKISKNISSMPICVSDICDKKNMIDLDYSGDGVQCSNVELIKDGQLIGVMSDKATSQTWKIPNTGNGRASAYDQPVLPRMRNTYLHNGESTPEIIISETQKGIYAFDIGGGQVDIKTGGFLFNVQCGYFIENGIPTALVKPFLFKGNALDVLSRIDKIGNDLKFQLATCGKLGQLLPISFGQPTIRIAKQRVTGG
jgi:hypothetical protein